jgi:hypothetical protein
MPGVTSCRDAPACRPQGREKAILERGRAFMSRSLAAAADDAAEAPRFAY